MKKLVLIVMPCLVSMPAISENTVQQAEFSSIQSCLASIKRVSGHELDIVIDKPEKVTGYLKGTKRHFACIVEDTGSKGRYVDGWFSN